MKKKMYLIAVFVFAAVFGYTQDTTYITKQQKIESIKNEAKATLKKQVVKINKEYEAGEITFEKAEQLKKEAATRQAMEIDRRTAELENAIAMDSVEYVIVQYPKRTKSMSLVGAFGINNVLQDGRSLNNSDFKGWGSRFAEISLLATTRLAEKTNFARLKYGLSFQFNALIPTDNRYFVVNDKVVSLEEYPTHLDKSKLNYYNLVVPVFLEIGGYKKTATKTEYVFSTSKNFKVGLGGYAGVSIGNRQKLKYEEDGKKTKEKIKASYPINEFIYGVGGYIGFGDFSLYTKYDLNPLFKDPNTKMNNISIGLRFEL